MVDVIERLQQFNQGIDPELLRMKYHAMHADAFAFFRGTCHLFYEDWPVHSPLNDAPLVWLCGDAHLQNFGSYKGDNRLVYFDINDFDESMLAPCTWDLARLLVSLLISAQTMKIDQAQALSVCQTFLNSYTSALAAGWVHPIDKGTAVGVVEALLVSLRERKRPAFLDSRTKVAGGKRKLLLQDKQFQAVTSEEWADVADLLEDWGTKQADAKFFTALDIAHRIAGVGSLGVRRYMVLVEGKGSPDQNYLLDLKEARPSSLQPYLKVPQPRWKSEAERVVTIQHWFQEVPPALLAAVELHDMPYVLRELQPTANKVDLEKLTGKVGHLENLLKTIGVVFAYGQLRSGGRHGSAIADELIAFAQTSDWQQALLEYAQAYAAQVEKDYQAFCSVYQHGVLSDSGGNVH